MGRIWEAWYYEAGGTTTFFFKSVGEEKGMLLGCWTPDGMPGKRKGEQRAAGKRQSRGYLTEVSPSRWFWDGTREGVGAARKG